MRGNGRIEVSARRAERFFSLRVARAGFMNVHAVFAGGQVGGSDRERDGAFEFGADDGADLQPIRVDHADRRYRRRRRCRRGILRHGEPGTAEGEHARACQGEHGATDMLLPMNHGSSQCLPLPAASSYFRTLIVSTSDTSV